MLTVIVEVFRANLDLIAIIGLFLDALGALHVLGLHFPIIARGGRLWSDAD